VNRFIPFLVFSGYCFAQTSTNLYLAQDYQAKWRLAFELDVGAGICTYADQIAIGREMSGTISPGRTFSPQLRVAVDPLLWPLGKYDGGLGVTYAYRFTTAFSVGAAKIDHRYSDMGFLFRIQGREQDVGFTLTYRVDNLTGSGSVGSGSSLSVGRAWGRVEWRKRWRNLDRVRYFVSADAGLALNTISGADGRAYYRDYLLLTGDARFGSIDSVISANESFVKGHFPMYEAGIHVGFRYDSWPKGRQKQKFGR